MKTTKILWSGLTGRTGRAAMEQQSNVDGVAIVAGLKRGTTSADDIQLRGGTFENVEWFDYETGMFGLYGLVQLVKRAEIDVIVDFSHPDVFDKALELAVRRNKPFVSGTSGLSNRQMALLYNATQRVPVFRGGNFRFKVKKFIDEAVQLALQEDGELYLYENFYQGKSLPSETSKDLRRRVQEATGRLVQVHSSADYAYGNLICDWEFQVRRNESPTNLFMEKIHCRTIGFDELAHDVLRIVKVMAKKPVRLGKFYDIDEIWDELVSWAI